MLPFDPGQLARRFDHPLVQAIVLTGSYARGDAGQYSDVDLLRCVSAEAGELPGAGTHLVDGRLVVVSDVDARQREEWFTRPEEAVNVVAGLRVARPLVDRDGVFAAVQQRAHTFAWDQALQSRANGWASAQMVGWIEEVHKGLAGLQHGDIGRLLNARFGLSWGLTRVVVVQRGILLTGDNAIWSQVEAALGRASEWVRLRRIAFGIDAVPLQVQVIAGLRLYVLTAEMLESAVLPQHAPLITLTVQRIEAALASPALRGANVAGLT